MSEHKEKDTKKLNLDSDNREIDYEFEKDKRECKAEAYLDLEKSKDFYTDMLDNIQRAKKSTTTFRPIRKIRRQIQAIRIYLRIFRKPRRHLCPWRVVSQMKKKKALIWKYQYLK